MYDKNSFRERIKIAADSVGGLNKLADLIGIPRRTLGDQIALKTEPKLFLIINIQKITGYSVQWLATGEGKRFIQKKVVDFSEPKSSVNMDRLQAAIKIIEESLEEYLLSPAKKAKLIKIAYDMLGEEEGAKKIGNIVRLFVN